MENTSRKPRATMSMVEQAQADGRAALKAAQEAHIAEIQDLHDELEQKHGAEIGALRSALAEAQSRATAIEETTDMRWTGRVDRAQQDLQHERALRANAEEQRDEITRQHRELRNCIAALTIMAQLSIVEIAQAGIEAAGPAGNARPPWGDLVDPPADEIPAGDEPAL